ncbi:hypothetical protein Tco_0580206 [Tanacetum coccineum]
MVAFLKKPTESVGFTEIVDFLKGTSLMYALTHNPTIYDSLVKQFWQTATVRTLANGIQELVASSYVGGNSTIAAAMLAVCAEDKVKARIPAWNFHHTTLIDPIPFHITIISSTTEHLIHHHYAGVNTGNTPVSTPSVVQTVNVPIPSPVKDQRKGKAPMTTEDVQATQKIKAQIEQEKAGLAEAMRLKALQDEEAARQVHLDALLAKRIQEEQELSEQQQKRKAKVQEASHDDFAKRMVDMINPKKKYYAEQKAKSERDKPMTQAQQRDYMSTFIKNQSSWKMAQLKKLTFEELKVEFEKLMRSIESFVPIGSKERVKRPVIEESDVEPVVAKEKGIEKPIKKRGKKRSKLLGKDKVTDSSSGSDIGIDAIPTATKPLSIVDWKIILQPELYRLVIKEYGANRPEEMYDRVLWGDLKTMFDPPLSDDAIWSWPLQQKMVNWRKYPLSKDACQAMLNMNLKGGIKDEVCYQLLKMIEKQARIRWSGI